MKCFGHTKPLIQTVGVHGNAGGVYVPKEWVGNLVEVRLLDPQTQSMKIIAPILERIESACYYGSWARGEQTRKSDLDIFIISSEELEIPHQPNIEVHARSVEQIQNATGSDLLFYQSILHEAKPLINRHMLANLKRDITPEELQWLVESTETRLKMMGELIDDETYTPSLIYSLVMRLRATYLAQCILKRKRYTTRQLEATVISSGLTEQAWRDIYSIYRAERDGKKPPQPKVYLEDLQTLHHLLARQTKKLKGKTHAKTKKTTKKGN